MAKIKDSDVKEVKRLLSLGWSISSIVEINPKLTKYIVGDIKRGKTWKHVL